MRREFSAGGVLVRRLRGQWMLAAIRPAGKPAGTWVLPKGQLDPGESDRGGGAARGRRGDRRRAAGSLAQLGDDAVLVQLGGRARRSRSSRSSSSRYESGRLGDLADEFRHEVAEVRWLPLAEAPDAPRLPRRARDGRSGRSRCWPRRRTYDRGPLPAFALNFYSPVVEAQLRSHRKTATIRLGDKSRKYQKGMIVSVLAARASAPASTSSTR